MESWKIEDVKHLGRGEMCSKESPVKAILEAPIKGSRQAPTTQQSTTIQQGQAPTTQQSTAMRPSTTTTTQSKRSRQAPTTQQEQQQKPLVEVKKEWEPWEVEHLKQLVREYGRGAVEQMYGKETVKTILEGTQQIQTPTTRQNIEKPQQVQQAQQQVQQTFGKEEIDKMVRQMVAKGMKPEDIQTELRKRGIRADIVKVEIQSPLKPMEQQTRAEQPKVADNAVKSAIGAIESATKPITDMLTDILWSDVRQRFAGTPNPLWLEQLEFETRGEKPNLSKLLNAYISPIETASKGFEEKGNVVAAGVTGFSAGALTMITAPIGIAEHVAKKGKEGGLAGLGEAVKDVALGTVEWVASIPGRTLSGSPSEIGKVIGEVAGGVIGGKLMEAPLKVPGKVYGEARFWGKEYVPFEKIAHPDVASGETKFTPVTAMEKGQYARPATPEEAVKATIKQFYENPTKEAVEVGEKYPALGWHGSPKAVEMGKGELEVKEGKPRPWDVAGLYVSGQAMDFFLKMKEYTSTLNPITAVKSMVQTIKEEGVSGFIKEEIRHAFGLPGKEGFIAVGMKGVKEVPKEFAEKGLGGYKEFFEKGPIEPGYAYIEPKTGILRQTWEHQAVIPKGALLENIHGKGFEKFTKVEIGNKELKVPIYEMVYGRVAEWRLPEAIKKAEVAERARKGEIKPYEQALKEYGFKEQVEYAGPRIVPVRPESGERSVKVPEEITRMTLEFRELKEVFSLPKELTESGMEKTVREVAGLRTPTFEILETFEIPEIVEPRMPKRGREIPEIAPSYEPILDIRAIYGPITGGRGMPFGGIEEMTRLIMYQEGRKKEEPYKVPGIDLEFFKKFNPVGELLGGRFRL